MHDTQQQSQQTKQNHPRPRGHATTDRSYQHCRMRDPIFVTAGPPIPDHVYSQTYKFATSMAAGNNEKRPTWVLGLRASDASTQKLASRVLRGNIETLRDDHATFLRYQQADRLQKCKAKSIFKIVQEAYALEAGRSWTLWAHRHVWDTCPVALKSVEDVLFFLEEKMRELSAGPTQVMAAMHPRLPTTFGNEEGKLIVQLVVEVSPTWPKLFEMADGSEDHGEEEEDEEEALIRMEMERLKLQWKNETEHEATTAGQKRIEAKEKALMRLIAEKEAESKGSKKRESATKVSSSRMEAQKKEEEKKEADRKEKEKRRVERAKKEEAERKQAEKERREKEKARLRRIEKEEEEKKQQRIADRQKREKERERRREDELQEEKDKKAKRERERTKDRVREKTNKQTGLVLAHGQISVGKVTPAPKPFLVKFMDF